MPIINDAAMKSFSSLDMPDICKTGISTVDFFSVFLKHADLSESPEIGIKKEAIERSSSPVLKGSFHLFIFPCLGKEFGKTYGKDKDSYGPEDNISP